MLRLTRLGLPAVALAVGLLPRRHGGQDQSRAEAVRQRDERPRAPTGTVGQVRDAGLGQLVPPDFGVPLLRRRHAAVDRCQLGAGFDLGQGAIERGAVDLSLQVVQVAFPVGRVHR